MDVTGFNKNAGYYDNTTIDFKNNLQNVAGDIVLVDSSSRNWNLESSDNYTIELGQKYKNVYAIELIDASIPSSGYVITDTNNVLIFREHDSKIYIHIPEGAYDINTLMTAIGDNMTSNSKFGHVYIASVNTLTKKITISETNSHEFDLIFENEFEHEYIGESGQTETIVFNPETRKKEIKKVQYGAYRNKYITNSIGKIIGFKPNNLYDKHTYTGQIIYNLSPFDYISIFVNTENNDPFKNIQAPSPHEGADGAFAIAKVNDGNTNSYELINFSNRAHYIRYFNPPIQFSKIKIEFKTMTGEHFNFYGLENYLLFEVRQMFGRSIVTNIPWSN